MRLLFTVVVVFVSVQITLADQFIGDPTGLSGPGETRLGRMLKATELPDRVKGEKELDHYFQCQLRDDAARLRYKDYKLTSGKYAQWAAETMDVPRALSSCLMFKETVFDNDRKSNRGAIGMAQFMPNSYFKKEDPNVPDDKDTGLRADLIEVQKNIAFEKEFDELLKNKNFYDITPEKNTSKNPFVKCHQFAQREGPYYFQATEAEKVKGGSDCKDMLTKYNYRKPLYEKYQVYLMYTLKNLDSVSAKKYFPNSKNGVLSPKDIVPPESLENMIKNPVVMTGLQMWYLKEMMYRMDFKVINKPIKDDDSIGYLMLLAGSYNAGPNAMLGSMESGGSVSNWCNNLISKGGKETKEYMLSVRRCLSQNDYNPPVGTDPSPTCNASFVTPIEDPCQKRVTGPARRPLNLPKEVER